MQKNKKVLVGAIAILILSIIFIIIFNNMSKNSNFGKNTNSQEIVNSILNLNSYETEIEVEVTSNKNTNKYVIKQKFNNNEFSQEVIEPANIAGTTIKLQNNNLILENTKLDAKNIIENYSCLSNNCLDLKCFIEDYKMQENSNYKETENEIIMKTKSSVNNKYIENKTLYLDKQTNLPTKILINSYNEKNTIYIKYSKIVINN